MTDEFTAGSTPTGGNSGQGPEQIPAGTDSEPVVADGHQTLDNPVLPFPIVGIGASAGGLEAYRDILEHLASDTGMAFVLVPHLSAEHKSHFVEILSRHTSLPVVEISDGIRPEPDHIYVVAPDTRLHLDNGVLRAEKRSKGRWLPIDHFFYSLAATQKSAAVGIVLSGADSDGALGLKRIKGEGGISIVQDEASAQFGAMPRAAIDADHVDMVLPPARIAAELAHLAQRFRSGRFEQVLDTVLDQEDHEKKAWSRIYSLLRTVGGIDFSQYKPTTVRRRVARRIVLQKAETTRDYAEFLEANPTEIRHLHEDILINVTRFFRDTAFFEALQSRVYPQLVKDRAAEVPIRIWVPGCSTGEEAYSLAISLLEYTSTLPSFEPLLQIFGTDVSERSIEKARTGIYPESIVADVSPGRLRRFFVRCEGGYQVSKRVRELCVFARQNLYSDPPFSRLDIISCRNVLIYLGAALQRSTIPIFHYALRPNGILVLGISETIREFPDLFILTDRKHKIYSKTSAPPRGHGDLAGRLQLPDRVARRTVPQVVTPPPLLGEHELQRAADRIVLSKFGPPGVIIDEDLHILQSRGNTSTYLQLAPGTATLNLLRMAKEPLAMRLRDAVHQAKTRNGPVRLENLRVNADPGSATVAVEVYSLENRSAPDRRFLVLFLAEADESPETRSPAADPASPASNDESRHIEQLTHELSSTHVYLQSLLDERESANQELISANEEIESSNEELQSINEELETAKEELQSTNEELYTVNEELQNRNTELAQTTNDLINLLNNITIPIVMIGSDFRIRQFTHVAERVMNLRPADLGRRVGEVRLNLRLDDLEPMIAEVAETLVTKQIEVQDRNDNWFQLRIRPYRTSDNKIEGVVLVLVDINDIRQVQEQLLTARNFADSIVDAVRTPIVVLTPAFTVRRGNPAFFALAGVEPAALDQNRLTEILGRRWGLEWIRPRLQELLARGPNSEPFTAEHQFHDGQSIRYLLVFARVIAPDEPMLLLAIDDVTAVRAAGRTQEEKQQLEGRVHLTQTALDRTRDEMGQLTALVLQAQEDERRRVARELHDDLSQKVAMLEVSVESLQKQVPRASRFVREHLNQLRADAATLSTDLRRIAYQLHPSILDDLGLPFALRALAEDTTRRKEIRVRFAANELTHPLPPQVSAALYRIGQEALRNAEKHAGGADVEMKLEQTATAVCLSIRDAGPGFDVQNPDHKRGIGLLSMRERAALAGGRFQLITAPGKGVEIAVNIPLDAESPA